jgi:hypothetical protein
MDYYNYYNADCEIYQSIPLTINDDVEFTTDLVEISPQKIFDLEPFNNSYYKYSGWSPELAKDSNLNNYPKYNNYCLKVSLLISLIIVFIIFIFVHFF